jgi:hypothetical protein
MKFCPFSGEECLVEKCALYSELENRCAFACLVIELRELNGRYDDND